MAATFSEFIEEWKAQMLTTQKPSSARAVRSHLECYILPELGNVRLDQFGVENQQKFITHMPERATEKRVSRKTVLNVLGTLSSILATARNWGYNCERIDTNKLRLPARGVKYEAPSFTPDQLRQILALAEEPWRTMFSVLTLDGLRAGEVLGLKWKDIDFDRSLLHIRRTAWYGKIQTAKSESSETVLPIPTSLLTLLKNYRKIWKANEGGFLFATRNGRPPSSNKVVEYHLWTILDGLGIPAMWSSRISPRAHSITFRLGRNSEGSSTSASTHRCAHYLGDLRARCGGCASRGGRKGRLDFGP